MRIQLHHVGVAVRDVRALGLAHVRALGLAHEHVRGRFYVRGDDGLTLQLFAR